MLNLVLPMRGDDLAVEHLAIARELAVKQGCLSSFQACWRVVKKKFHALYSLRLPCRSAGSECIQACTHYRSVTDVCQTGRRGDRGLHSLIASVQEAISKMACVLPGRVFVRSSLLCLSRILADTL